MHLTDKPLAAKGLNSYRYKGRYGWIMIGANSIDEALNEARRSTYDNKASVGSLEVHNGTCYVIVPFDYENMLTSDDYKVKI